MTSRDDMDAADASNAHSFAQLLRRALGDKGWTGSKLAQSLHVSSSTVSKWLSGTRPNPEIATKIEELLNRGGKVVATGSLRTVLEREIAAFDQRTATARARSRLEDASCPYRGLFAFGEDDSRFFFGRARFTAALDGMMRRSTFVAVIGPSGCGKSSLIFAGLLPGLREDGWQIVALRPGSHPFRALAAVLLPLLEPQLSQTDRMLETEKLTEALRSGALALGEVVKQFLTTAGGKRLLLVVDQFEELYTLDATEEERQRFADALLEGIASFPPEQDGGLTVVVALRADFLGQALSYRPLADALHADIKLGPMNRQELQASIEEPARLLGVKLEEGLTARLLDAVSAEPGHLPLLEFMLTLLWERQQAGQLTHAAYERLGGVEQGLSRFAEEVYERLSDGDQDRAAKIFLQLVRPGEGTEDTRRRATRAEVREENWDLVQRLATVRLVVTGQEEVTGEPTAEIVHEALIAHWPRLRMWMTADRTFRSWQERLREAMRRWEASGRDEGGLLRGAFLAEASGWRERRNDDLGPAETSFIDVSAEAVERAQRDKERARRRRTAVAIALSLALGVIGATSVVALGQRNEAESRRLAAGAAVQLSVDPERSLLLALEAYDTSRTKEAEEVLRQATLESCVRATLRQKTFSRTAAFSRDGRTVMTVGGDGTVQVWDWAKGRKSAKLPRDKAPVRAAAFSPDGQLVAGAGDDGTVRVWTWARQQEPVILRGHEGTVRSVAFSPDGQLVMIAAADTIRIWMWAGAGDPVTVNVGSSVMSASFSPDGQLVVAGTGEGRVVELNWKTRDSLLVGRHNGNVLAVAFSPNGRWIVSAGEDATVRVFEWGSATQHLVLRGHEARVKVAAFSPNGRWIVTASDDDTVRVWEWASDGEPLIMRHDGSVGGVDFSSNGRWVASGGDDRTVRIWESASGKPVKTLWGHQSSVRSVDFSPDDRMNRPGIGRDSGGWIYAASPASLC